jgi:hypothetical protein
VSQISKSGIPVLLLTNVVLAGALIAEHLLSMDRMEVIERQNEALRGADRIMREQEKALKAMVADQGGSIILHRTLCREDLPPETP